MAYQALYRTWRPSRFGDVVGQDHIIKVLSGQIAEGKIAHAYLFAGPRGTGKTSLAKIFAKAVNCTSREGFEPCGKCAACSAAASAGAVDIIEIDAASNNGVDSVREIRDRVSLLPALCTHKVYIIDEVHMLSKGAFNALLKTLEEPPPHVIFILATTEPFKLPATIRSRCQRFDFKRIPLDIITQRLKKVAKAEGYIFEPDALTMIARAAEGGMRDALSILDQCTAYGDITPDTVSGTLGGSDMRSLLTLTEHIAKYNEKAALEQLRTMIDAGADTRTLIKDLADIFRRMMWMATGASIEGGDALAPLAKTFGKAACIRALDILIQKEYEMRQNLRADIVLETAVMHIMCPEDDASATDTQRLEKLEGRLAVLEREGIRPAAPAPQTHKKTEPTPAKKPQAKQPAKRPPVPSADKAQAADKIWEKLLTALREHSYFVFTHAQKAKEVLAVGNVLEIKYAHEDDISASFMRSDETKKTLMAQMKSIAQSIASISVVTEPEEKDSTIGTSILEMFGEDIEQV